jgi:ParB family chromosome partitioning protein
MKDPKTTRPRLGRGLSALLGDDMAIAAMAQEPPLQAGDAAEAPRAAQRIGIDRIRPNTAQPRTRFEAVELDELAASIRAHGVLQPVILRPHPDGTDYEIVAGERRWRAAQIAGLHELPVIVRALDDLAAAEVALVENLQRADLDPVEEALAYRKLVEAYGKTQEEVAAAVGKSRSHVANALRLLRLPPGVLEALGSGLLSAGHARPLIGQPNAEALAQQVILRGLSVRDTERLVKNGSVGGSRPPRFRAAGDEVDADTRHLEGDLSANLGMSVRIRHEPGGESGILSIRYNTLDDLELLCRVLASIPRHDEV